MALSSPTALPPDLESKESRTLRVWMAQQFLRLLEEGRVAREQSPAFKVSQGHCQATPAMSPHKARMCLDPKPARLRSRVGSREDFAAKSICGNNRKGWWAELPWKPVMDGAPPAQRCLLEARGQVFPVRLWEEEKLCSAETAAGLRAGSSGEAGAEKGPTGAPRGRGVLLKAGWGVSLQVRQRSSPDVRGGVTPCRDWLKPPNPPKDQEGPAEPSKVQSDGGALSLGSLQG